MADKLVDDDVPVVKKKVKQPSIKKKRGEKDKARQYLRKLKNVCQSSGSDMGKEYLSKHPEIKLHYGPDLKKLATRYKLVLS